jgi:hypothetical protein
MYVLRQNCRAAGWRWDTKTPSLNTSRLKRNVLQFTILNTVSLFLKTFALFYSFCTRLVNSRRDIFPKSFLGKTSTNLTPPWSLFLRPLLVADELGEKLADLSLRQSGAPSLHDETYRDLTEPAIRFTHRLKQG